MIMTLSYIFFLFIPSNGTKPLKNTRLLRGKQYKKMLIARPINAQELRPKNITTNIAFKMFED